MVAEKFYVYDLIDPRNGEVFYVGKGSGLRYEAHAQRVALALCDEKSRTIASIILDGREVKSRIVSWHEDEDEAYEKERERIDFVGREQLTNGTPGRRVEYPVRFEFMLKRADKNALKAMAEQQQVTVSDLIREAIRDKITPERRAS